MARTRVSKTITIGELKFKPQSGRERSTAAGPERYWQARRYIGMIDGKARREQVWRGWARAEQLPAIAANLAGGRASTEKTSLGPRLASLEDLRAGTVALLIKAWRGDRSGDRDYSKHTRKHEQVLARRLTAVVGQLLVKDVDSDNTGKYLRKELRKQYAVSTVRITMTVFSGIWGWAFKHRIVDRPLDFREQYRRLREAEKKGYETGAREKTTPDEAAAWAISDAMDAGAPAWAALGYRLLLMTGGRIGEIAVLTWGQVSTESVRLVGKTGPRDVFVDARALAPVLEGRPMDATDETRVLTVTVGTARKHLGVYIGVACETAGVPRITPHAMRRFAVQRYIRAGIAPSVAAEQFGHTPGVMLKHYEQVQASDKKTAARKAGLGVRPGVSRDGAKVVKLHG
jgi:integrase